VLGRPKICKLAHEFLWEYSYKALKLANLAYFSLASAAGCRSTPAGRRRREVRRHLVMDGAVI
jgi:hypothetical protein